MADKYKAREGFFSTLRSCYKRFVYGTDDTSHIPEEQKIKMRGQASVKVIPGIIAGLAALAAPTIFHYCDSKTGRDRIQQEPRITIEQVLEKAAGEDKLLSRDEGIRFARDLGYDGVIVEDEPLEFDPYILSDNVGLVQGHRQLHVFDQNAFRNYMKR